MIGSLSKEQLNGALGNKPKKKTGNSEDISELARVINHNAKAMDAEINNLARELTMTNLVLKIVCKKAGVDMNEVIQEANNLFNATKPVVEDMGDHPDEATFFGG